MFFQYKHWKLFTFSSPQLASLHPHPSLSSRSSQLYEILITEWLAAFLWWDFPSPRCWTVYIAALCEFNHRFRVRGLGAEADTRRECFSLTRRCHESTLLLLSVCDKTLKNVCVRVCIILSHWRGYVETEIVVWFRKNLVTFLVLLSWT